MIDTDKYEGHTEGPWNYEIPETGDNIITDVEGEFVAQVASREDAKNAQLIADAPLLLAEVKRWYKVRDYILEKASYPTVKKLHLKDLLNFMEEVIE